MMISAFCLVIALAASAGAQTVSPGLEHANPEMRQAAEGEVRARLDEFLKKLDSRDIDGIRALFVPKALITVVRQQGDRTFSNNYQSRDEFAAQFEKSAGQPKFALANAVVTIESERLAHVRADYMVIRDGKRSSSGVDHFMLVKESDGWKIAGLAYTLHPAHP
jgi:ketosteroid isomerase-like protein